VIDDERSRYLQGSNPPFVTKDLRSLAGVITGMNPGKPFDLWRQVQRSSHRRSESFQRFLDRERHCTRNFRGRTRNSSSEAEVSCKCSRNVDLPIAEGPMSSMIRPGAGSPSDRGSRWRRGMRGTRLASKPSANESSRIRSTRLFVDDETLLIEMQGAGHGSNHDVRHAVISRLRGERPRDRRGGLPDRGEGALLERDR
jgi:hypothetical protein